MQKKVVLVIVGIFFVIIMAISGLYFFYENQKNIYIDKSNSDTNLKVPSIVEVINDSLFEISGKSIGTEYNGIKNIDLQQFDEKIKELNGLGSYKVTAKGNIDSADASCDLTIEYRFNNGNYEEFVVDAVGGTDQCVDIKQERQFRINGGYIEEYCYKPFYQPVVCEFQEKNTSRINYDPSYLTRFPIDMIDLRTVKVYSEPEKYSNSIRFNEYFVKSYVLQNYNDEYSEGSEYVLLQVADKDMANLSAVFYEKKDSQIILYRYYFDSELNLIRAVDWQSRKRMQAEFSEFGNVGEIVVPGGSFAPYAVGEFLRNAL